VAAVVVVAGLTGLGKPLAAESVHRPEIFSELAGLAQGQPVTVEALARVLCHSQGGLKNIPPNARRLALLNQADSDEQRAAGARLAGLLLSGGYDAVVLAALAPAADCEQGQFCTAYERTAGIVLAAGGSTRMGQPKQLLTWRGEPLVRRAARAALESGLSPVVVVTGAYGAAVEAALAGLEVQIAPNPRWAEGQSSSLAAGLQRLPVDCGSALFLLADQPLVPPSLIHSLVALHAENLASIVVPLIDGQRGNPVLFDRCTFPDLLSLQGDQGGRALFSRYPLTWLPWHDAALLLDVDTQEDYDALSRLT
jgi:molybdenum cofactor cytidylyltransferase